MNIETQVLALFEEGNPVPDLDMLEPIEPDAAAYLATLEQRSSGMTQLDIEKTDENKKGWVRSGLVAAVVVILAGVGIFLITQSDEAPTASQLGPSEVLANYQEARNAGDVDAVMAFYAEDAVVRDHPLDNDSVATGADEIRALEERIPGVQGSGDGIEFMDIQASGNTVTFDHRFFYGADGTRSGGSAGCAGGFRDTVTVENGKITLYDWGTDSPIQCLD